MSVCVLNDLIQEFSKLPSVGKRSAKKITYHLLSQADQIDLDRLMNKLSYAKQHIQNCEICHNISFTNKCDICSDQKRNKSLLCIVEKPQHIETIEKSESYYGVYHVIGGVLSVFDGITPEHLNIASLKRRIENETITEIIFSLPPSQDSYITLHYIRETLSPFTSIKMTIPAHGIPLGSDLDYLDQGTIMTAFTDRRPIEVT